MNKPLTPFQQHREDLIRKGHEKIHVKMPTFEAIMVEIPGVIPGKKITLSERRIYWMLRAARGRAITIDTFIEALYLTRSANELPDADIIKVWISHLRKKINGIKIVNYKKVGYAMIVDDDPEAIHKVEVNKASMVSDYDSHFRAKKFF